MAPISPQNGLLRRACDNEDGTQDARNADITTFRMAQEELYVACQSVEQLLNMIRTGNSQQVEALFAFTRSGASKEEILAVVRQYNQDAERAQS